MDPIPDGKNDPGKIAPSGKVGLADKRARAVADIDARARKKIGGRRGRAPGGPKEPEGPGNPPADGKDIPPTNNDRRGADLDAGRLILGQTVRAIKGYRYIGHAVTGDPHWKDCPDEAVDAAALAIGEMLPSLHPVARGVILSGIAWAGAITAAWEVVGDPVFRSLKLKRERDAAKKANAIKAEAVKVDDGTNQ